MAAIAELCPYRGCRAPRVVGCPCVGCITPCALNAQSLDVWQPQEVPAKYEGQFIEHLRALDTELPAFDFTDLFDFGPRHAKLMEQYYRIGARLDFIAQLEIARARAVWFKYAPAAVGVPRFLAHYSFDAECTFQRLRRSHMKSATSCSGEQSLICAEYARYAATRVCLVHHAQPGKMIACLCAKGSCDAACGQQGSLCMIRTPAQKGSVLLQVVR